MRRPAITAIFNAHREGMLAKPSLESLKRAITKAEEAGDRVETLIVLDCGDEATRQVLLAHGPQAMRLIEVEYGDPGKSRNHGVQVASGRYVAFLDGDDLWESTWLALARQAADARRDMVIWHPEVNVYIGAAKHVHMHVDMEDKRFRPACMLIENCWTALSFGKREIYVAHPYPETDLSRGFGFEDWTWNMTTIAAGAVHKVVAGTGHVIRRRFTTSVSLATVRTGAIARPTDYLAAYLRRRGESSQEWADGNIWARATP
jgi:glycosyltransferase involved in cell wall biosynthesis